MDRKDFVGESIADRKKLQNAYAVWGTTREAHLEKMWELIKEQNAKVKEESL